MSSFKINTALIAVASNNFNCGQSLAVYYYARLCARAESIFGCSQELVCAPGAVHRHGQLIGMQFLWALPKDSKHNGASFSLCLRVAQMPRPQDLIVGQTDWQNRLLYPLLCMCVWDKNNKRAAFQYSWCMSISTKSSYAALEPRYMTCDCGHTYSMEF